MTGRGLSLPAGRPPAPRLPCLHPRRLGRWLLARGPLHLALIVIVLLWSIPTIALLVSSFRDPTAIAASGWWEAIKGPPRLHDRQL